MLDLRIRYLNTLRVSKNLIHPYTVGVACFHPLHLAANLKSNTFPTPLHSSYIIGCRPLTSTHSRLTLASWVRIAHFDVFVLALT